LPAYAEQVHPRSFGPEADRYRGMGDWQYENIDKDYGAGTYQRKSLKGKLIRTIKITAFANVIQHAPWLLHYGNPI
jgi:hypothetical protein